MKKNFLLLLLHLSAFGMKLPYIYAWNEEHILQQQKCQQDLIENKDMFILDVIYKETNDFFYPYYIVNSKNFSNKYLSLVPIYNKIANNYLKNKKEINEFYINYYKTCEYAEIIKMIFTVIEIGALFRILYERGISSISKVAYISHSIASFIDMFCYIEEPIQAASHGIFLDDINLTKSYLLFSLKLIVSILNVCYSQYHYIKNKYTTYYFDNNSNKNTLFLAGVLGLDIVCIYFLHQCKKNINLNKNKYIKITKKEYKHFQIIRNMPLFVVLKKESGYSAFSYINLKNKSSYSGLDYISNNFYETKEGYKKCGYAVTAFYHEIQMVNNL